MMQSNTIHESDETVKSFADLPTEMVIAILIHVGTFDLLKLRQVNRRWNVISTEIIQNRDDITLHFEHYNGNFIQSIPHRNSKKLLIIERDRTSVPGSKILNDLVAYLQNCKHLQEFPYTAFQFDVMSHVRNQDMQNFLKTFGENIRSLKLGLGDVNRSEMMQAILESTPNLKKLEIDGFWIYTTSPSIIGICVKPHQTFHNLEVLSVDSFHRTHPKIIEDILTMSPQLKRVSFGDLRITGRDLQMLESTNKLNCLKTLTIHITKNIIAHWKKSLQCFDLQLESLNVSVSKSVAKNPQLKLDATEIVSQLFDSSKDVMHTLCTDMLGFLSELQLPQLEKLRTLRLRANFRIVPPFLDWLTSFPNIKELDVDLSDTEDKPAGSLKSQQIRLPSVEIVRIDCERRRDIRNLIRMTPNAQTLLIVDETSFTYEDIIIVSFDEILTHLPRLVNFGWKMHCPDNHSQHKLDAVLTGLSKNLCKQLAVKFSDKGDSLSAEEIAAYQRGRIRSSILDLKDLRHLELDWSEEIDFNPDSHFYNTGITKVSKLLGFDLIPGLKVLIRRF